MTPTTATPMTPTTATPMTPTTATPMTPTTATLRTPTTAALRTPTATPRLAPLDPPYDAELARTLERMMPPGIEPLTLFRTVAHNRHVLDKLRSTGAYLLNHGTLDPADRELVIDRTCARCGAEYEWAVHVAVYAEAVGLTDEQIDATVHGSADDPAFTEPQALLISLVDELHDTATVSDGLWAALAARYTEAQLVELITLVGQYHTVSFYVGALRIPPEARFRRRRAFAAAATKP
jgi:4-carboxymuconolactone decarboxylase